MTVQVQGFEQKDPRLGWVSEHDERSRAYPVRSVLPVSIEERPKQWRQKKVALDQGREGACVGYAWTQELTGSPRPDPYVDVPTASTYARQVYRRAQRIDQWPGEAYEGTSVLAGAKIVQQDTHIGEYRWAFGIDDVRDTILTLGPVVIGIPWYSGMYDTRPSGLVDVSGSQVGGHALVVYGYHPGMRIYGEDWHARYRVFRWRNSWGPSYGKNGNGLIRYEDLRDLLAGWGEACIPDKRRMVRLPQ